MKIEVPADKRFIVNDLKKLIDISIEIYSIIFLKEEYKLSDREKDFFIGCVLAYHENVGLQGKPFNNYMMTNYGFSNKIRPIYGMRDVMKKKKWLIQTPMGYDIPSLFKQDIKNLYLNLVINHV